MPRKTKVKNPKKTTAEKKKAQTVAVVSRVFGVKVAPLTVKRGLCVCGKPTEECHTDWDARLGITGHTGDTGGGMESEYLRNLRRIRQARVEGEDPYCFAALLKSCGYVSSWTPKREESRMILPLTMEKTSAKTAKKSRTKSRGKP